MKKVILFATAEKHFRELYGFLKTFPDVFCKPTFYAHSLVEIAIKEQSQIIIVCDCLAAGVADRARENIKGSGKFIRVINLPMIYGELANPEWKHEILEVLVASKRKYVLTLGQRLRWRPR